ncbi:MAG: hypothetical protein UU01_C0013G0002 [Parcubacteria group bacterium GW2011_GWA2_40_37]|nr:MAG: hypothetical protein UU01_C0013G0002 [Parcubacteria group bacterium GW2011_GWA2_40_37]
MENKDKQSENIIKISDPQTEGKEILQRGIESIPLPTPKYEAQAN